MGSARAAAERAAAEEQRSTAVLASTNQRLAVEEAALAAAEAAVVALRRQHGVVTDVAATEQRLLLVKQARSHNVLAHVASPCTHPRPRPCARQELARATLARDHATAEGESLASSRAALAASVAELSAAQVAAQDRVRRLQEQAAAKAAMLARLQAEHDSLEGDVTR